MFRKPVLCVLFICFVNVCFCQYYYFDDRPRWFGLRKAYRIISLPSDTTFTNSMKDLMQNKKPDSLLNKELFSQIKLLQNSIMPTPDAISLLNILNPNLSDSSYKLSQNVLLPEYPINSKRVERKNDRIFKRYKKPHARLTMRYKDLAFIVNERLSILQQSTVNSDSILLFLKDLKWFRKYASATNRLTMQFLNKYLSQIVDLSNKYETDITNRREILSMMMLCINDIYEFLPDRKFMDTTFIGINDSGLRDSPVKGFAFSRNSINTLSDFGAAPNDEYFPDNTLVRFNIYVYNSANTNDYKTIFKAPNLKGAYTIIYQAPLNVHTEECDRKASVAFVVLPLARYLFGVEKDGKPICAIDINLRKYLSAQNWQEYDKLALVFDINPKVINK